MNFASDLETGLKIDARGRRRAILNDKNGILAHPNRPHGLHGSEIVPNGGWHHLDQFESIGGWHHLDGDLGRLVDGTIWIWWMAPFGSVWIREKMPELSNENRIAFGCRMLPAMVDALELLQATGADYDIRL